MKRLLETLKHINLLLVENGVATNWKLILKSVVQDQIQRSPMWWPPLATGIQRMLASWTIVEPCGFRYSTMLSMVSQPMGPQMVHRVTL